MVVGGYNSSYHIGPLAYVRLNTAAGFYGVPLTAMSVGGTVVSGMFGTTMIDSGTTYVYMASAMYKGLRSAIESYCRQNHNCGSKNAGTCWTVPDKALIIFPIVNVMFGKVKTVWKPSAYLYRKGTTSKMCYAFQDDGPRANTVLGAAWMLEHEVIFDMAQTRVGIADAKCPDFRKRPTHDPHQDMTVPGEARRTDLTTTIATTAISAAAVSVAANVDATSVASVAATTAAIVTASMTTMLTAAVGTARLSAPTSVTSKVVEVEVPPVTTLASISPMPLMPSMVVVATVMPMLMTSRTETTSRRPALLNGSTTTRQSPSEEEISPTVWPAGPSKTDEGSVTLVSVSALSLVLMAYAVYTCLPGDSSKSGKVAVAASTIGAGKEDESRNGDASAEEDDPLVTAIRHDT